MPINYSPRIVAFCCNWCSYAGADLAGTSRLNYPTDVKIIRIPCSCRVDALFILRAFQKGADGVIVCGCHPGDCHYSTGNYYTRRRMTLLFNMLEFLGIERERIHLEWVSASEGAKFAQTMERFVEQVSELGKNERFMDFQPIAHEGAMPRERERSGIHSRAARGLGGAAPIGMEATDVGTDER